MPSHYAEFVKANYSNVKDLPAKERFAALAKMWNKQKVIKQDKPTKDKPTKVKKAVAKGGAFIPEQSPSKSSVISVLDALKSNNIEKGRFQQFEMQRPPAINQSTLQQLIKKH